MVVALRLVVYMTVRLVMLVTIVARIELTEPFLLLLGQEGYGR